MTLYTNLIAKTKACGNSLYFFFCHPSKNVVQHFSKPTLALQKNWVDSPTGSLGSDSLNSWINIRVDKCAESAWQLWRRLECKWKPFVNSFAHLFSLGALLQHAAPGMSVLTECDRELCYHHLGQHRPCALRDDACDPFELPQIHLQPLVGVVVLRQTRYWSIFRFQEDILSVWSTKAGFFDNFFF